ncbi:hypothetical protein [Pseudooceanicola aestuarii]|uniref:hypothetical protein n=1 Tax=Pseudooceanicola aestuarii TaxID=2697319 RepID=UPI0013D35DB1|nr:hypothetical protein [Pseudooceanicola aestuarii]
MRAARHLCGAAAALLAAWGAALPVLAQPVEVATGPDLPAEEALMLRRALQKAQLFLKSEIGGGDDPDYAGLRVLGSHDPDWLTARLAEERLARTDATRLATDACTGGVARISGRAGPGWILLCWPGHEMGLPRVALRVEDRLAPMAVHELTHAVQQAHAGARAGVARDLPIWFIEGVAEDLEQRFDTRSPRTARRSLSQAARQLEHLGSSLTEMSGGALTAEDYDVAALALRVLVARHGGDPMEVWRLIGQGQDAMAAFEAVFDADPQDFARLFEAARRDPDALLALADGA